MNLLEIVPAAILALSLFGRAVMTRLTERQALKDTTAEERPKIIRELRRRPDLRIGPVHRHFPDAD